MNGDGGGIGSAAVSRTPRHRSSGRTYTPTSQSQRKADTFVCLAERDGSPTCPNPAHLWANWPVLTWR